ncbi:autotransporter outer membrane beta-barrel domain-containing protein [Fusobacterium ulcerans]|uniref:autotransporter outer membrane beta-barrel domain-containing protein n=1 Tax=Fusobacterium ulcerans TaxID=861 RepID=UPI001032AE40|nr:autotransporter outer membrane beta-barrel domain-containing protein [Fusobacterium ulcerans]
MKNSATTKIDTSNKINLSGSKNIGIYVDNSADLTFENSLDFTNSNINENIYLYAKNTNIDIAVKKTLTVDGGGIPVSPDENKKTIGVFITDNSTIKGDISVKGGAIGIYANGSAPLDISLTAEGTGTTGAFLDGASTISGIVTAKGDATAGAIGVYGSSGKVTIGTTGIILKMDNGIGTGMYLTGGAYADGGLITVNNSGADNNIGVFYSKGAVTAGVTNSSEISLKGNKSIGIYAADGIALTNNAKIISSVGTNKNIASYVGEGSTLTSAGNIAMSGIDDIGIFVGDGTGINIGTVDISGATPATGSVTGMVAQADAGATASIENKAIIEAGANLGMYIEGTGTSSGKNTGDIDVTTGTGVYLEGANASFDGTAGTITTRGTSTTETNGVGIYLKDTVTGAVADTGTLNIALGGVGVYGNSSIIDFTVDTSTSTGATSVVAKGGRVSGVIKAGTGAIGLYLVDDTTTISGLTITTGQKTSTSTSTGVYLKAAGNYTLSNVNIDAQDGIGICLDNSITSGSGAKTLTYNGTITTTNGQGIYVNTGNTLTTGMTTFNVNGTTGIGVYIASGATAYIGQTTTTTFNLNDGTAIHNAGGTLNLGANVAITGSGSLVGTTDGDIISEANFTVGARATGLLGKYSNATTVDKYIRNRGTITVQSDGIGIAAIKASTSPTGNITITNDTNGKLYVSGKNGDDSSIGMYTDIAKVENKGYIEVGTDGVGIFIEDSGKDITSTTIDMTGANGVAVYAEKNVGDVILDGITSTSSKNIGVILNNISLGNISLGNISLGNESVGVMVGDGQAQIAPTGTNISVGDSSADKSAIGVMAKKSNMDFVNMGNIIAGVKGIGVYAYDNAIVSNIDLNKITVGAGGTALYSVGSTLTNVSGSIGANNKIGISIKGGSITGNITDATVSNGGTGLYLDSTNIGGLGIGNINVQAGRDKDNQSLGVYYKDIASSVNLYGIIQTGAYTIGSLLKNTSGTTGALNLTNTSNSVGIIIESSANNSLTIGNITVSGAKNIGVHSKGGVVTTGLLNVSNSSYSEDKSLSSIGVYAENGGISTSGINIDDNSIGIYSEEARRDVFVNGNISVGNNGLGIYASKKTGNAKIDVINGTHTVGDNSAIGIFGENIDINISGGFTIGINTSFGIVSKGDGDIASNGDIAIGNSSIGIYKIGGSGDITVGAGTFTVDKKGYGIYATETSGTITNNANISLEESAIGIYSNGTNTIHNSGVITVGKTSFGPDGNPGTTGDNINSVGIFMSGGTTVSNTGIINVNETLSVGVYSAEKGNLFINQASGIINVDNGGIGVIVKGGAIAENNGTINLGGTINTAGESIGMAGYSGSTIVNNTSGVINVTEGIGMYVATGAMLENKGTISILNGTGIFGDGQIVNHGNIYILPGGTGDLISDGTVISTGSIQIDKNGNVTINDKLHALGGTITVDGTLDLNGVFVDITGKPVFEADSVTGEVNILPNFALTGNGYTYKIEGFLNTVDGALSGGKVSPNLSPLWVADIDRDGDLIIVKRPYADITIGNQFDNLDKGLDNILMGNGNSEDKDILKGLNHYLSGLSEEDYKKEAGKMLGETRGDIYSTIQGRMQDINRAFDNSFYELESSYNLTKDSSKYSVIYADGNYKDSTLGIDEYDYKVMGLLYMKEKEGTEYGSKYGYTIGFAGSKFDFDDGGSKEDVYSLRAGVHRVKNLSEEHKVSWLSRIELGYNRHIAKRKLNLHETFENKGEYNTYSVALDNRLTKVIYTDLSRELDIYADLDLEYGKVDGFTESAGSNGGLEVQIKDDDYLSAQLGAGVKASQRIYAGNDISVKVTADVKYAYELGDNYDGNKARLKNGGEGYYSLITPDEREGKLIGKVGLTVEKANYMGVTFEVEAADEGNREDSSVKYGVRFNYKF